MLTKIKKFTNLPLSRKIQFIVNKYHQIKTQTFYKMLFKSIGKNSSIRNPLLLTPEFITIGKNVTIWNDVRIEGVHSYAYKTFNPHIIIEDGVSFQQRCHITAADTLIIGKNSIISFDVSIQDTDHEYENLTLPIAKQPLIVKKTTIGENCFIGSGVKIQAGTVLGQHCVVGTNAVVRGTFPDYSVIVGVPAKIVKRYDENKKIWRKIDKYGEFNNEI